MLLVTLILHRKSGFCKARIADFGRIVSVYTSAGGAGLATSTAGSSAAPACSRFWGSFPGPGSIDLPGRRGEAVLAHAGVGLSVRSSRASTAGSSAAAAWDNPPCGHRSPGRGVEAAHGYCFRVLLDC